MADGVGSLRERLVALHGELRGMRVRRGAVEAPIELTTAYVDLLFGIGIARLGGVEEARTLAAAAVRDVLGHWDRDPIHAWLTDAFAARIDQAIAGVPPQYQLPRPIIDRLEALDRVARYKVDRVREVSLLLDDSRPDAIGGFSLRRHDVTTAEPERSAPAVRAGELDHRIDEVEQGGADQRSPRLAACLRDLHDMPVDLGVPILARLIPLVEPLGAPELLGDAIVHAARYGWGELVIGPVRALRRILRASGLAGAGAPLLKVLRALRVLDARFELGELLGDVEQLLASSRPATAVVESTLARELAGICTGIRAYLADAASETVFDQALEALAQITHPTNHLLAVRGVALGATFASVDVALATVAKLARTYPEITDSFGTNSHFCLARIHYADVLVHAVVEVAPLAR